LTLVTNWDKEISSGLPGVELDKLKRPAINRNTTRTMMIFFENFFTIFL